MLCGDSNRAIGASNDGARVVEGIGAAKVNDESSVIGTGHEGHTGANFNAECFVGLGVRDAWLRSCIGTPASSDVDGARRRSGTTRVRFRTNTGGI